MTWMLFSQICMLIILVTLMVVSVINVVIKGTYEGDR